MSKIKKNDAVIVIAGRSKGTIGSVLQVVDSNTLIKISLSFTSSFAEDSISRTENMSTRSV